MKVSYDAEVDIVRIILSDRKIIESEENDSGIILDYDEEGNIVAMEILGASEKMENPRSIEHIVNEKSTA